MAIDQRLNAIHDTQRELATMQEELRGMHGGSGGGSGVEQIDGRVGRLERQWDSLQDTLSGLKTSLATLEERTKHMPTRFEFYTVIFGTGAFFTTLLTIAIRLGWI